MKKLFYLSIFVIAGFVLGACGPASIGTFTIGTNAEYPPFEYVDDQNNIVGFDIELMTAIADEGGFDFEFVNTRWDGIFVALAAGEFDAVISAATITAERAETVNFSDPYFNAGQMIKAGARLVSRTAGPGVRWGCALPAGALDPGLANP